MIEIETQLKNGAKECFRIGRVATAATLGIGSVVGVMALEHLRGETPEALAQESECIARAIHQVEEFDDVGGRRRFFDSGTDTVRSRLTDAQVKYSSERLINGNEVSQPSGADGETSMLLRWRCDPNDRASMVLEFNSLVTASGNRSVEDRLSIGNGRERTFRTFIASERTVNRDITTSATPVDRPLIDLFPTDGSVLRVGFEPGSLIWPAIIVSLGLIGAGLLAGRRGGTDVVVRDRVPPPVGPVTDPAARQTIAEERARREAAERNARVAREAELAQARQVAEERGETGEAARERRLTEQRRLDAERVAREETARRAVQSREVVVTSTEVRDLETSLAAEKAKSAQLEKRLREAKAERRR